MELAIDRRFRGPSTSANGGYACGLVASAFTEPVEVTLRLPPPLGTKLRLDGDRVLAGDAVVATVHPSHVHLDLPAPVSFEAATAAAHADLDSPFPECFVCGHQRDDGLRIFAGPAAGRDVVAAPWVADPSTCDPVFVWAALDCPGAYATGALGRGTVVLGRLAANVHRVPRPGERCVVVGWPLGSEGRKHGAGTALFGEDEDVIGFARAVWIEPR